LSKSINISTSLKQTINDNVDLSSCVSATDWNEENIELNTDVLSRLANLESEMTENSNAIDILEANQLTLVNYDGSVDDIEISTYNEASSVSFSMDRNEILSETFDELLTQDKHIIGAINEVFLSGVSVKQQLVDALIAKGVEGISTSDSFEILIGKIADI
jgi:hypothetical protein